MAKEISKAWWKESKADVCSTIHETINFVKTNQDWRQQLNHIHMRLYQNMKSGGVEILNYAAFGDISQSYGNRLTLNVIQSAIDTLANRISKNKPKVSFLTDGGSFSQKKRARKLTKFMMGVFRDAKVYQNSQFAFLDECVFGTGAMQPFREGKEIKTERIWINEIYIDDVDGAYMNPRQIFRVKSVPRSVLKAKFPGQSDQIDKVKRKEIPGNARFIADNVEVYDSTHLPSKKGAKDGRRVICLPNVTLSDSVWEHDYLPFEFIRFKNRLLGFWGQGVAEMLSNIQLEINRTIQVIQKSLRLVSVPRVFLEKGSNVIPQQINNDVGGILHYVGTPPIFDTARSVSPELSNHLENLYRKAFEIIGISQLAAQAKKPSGLDAAVALREFDDIESERHILLGQEFQDFHVRLADRFIDLICDMEKDGIDYEVKVKVDSTLETIKWSEVKMDRKNYQLEAYPTSLLPNRPEGRLQKVQEMAQAGFFTIEEAAELLDFPDINSVTSRKNAGIRLLGKIVERFLDADEDDPSDSFIPPEPYMNLTQGIKFMQESYLQAKMDNVEEFKLSLFRDWIDQAQAMIKAAQPAQAQAQAPIDPLAVAEAPPVSDLINNVPGTESFQ
jgi:hypothetical protein